MKVMTVRHAHQAIHQAVRVLFGPEAQTRDSRNGEVRTLPHPVATVYQRPLERIVWYPERDYNIAFCLYEALWMLEGRRDVAPLTRYVSNFGNYSDDGQSLHAAYGWRWRRAFGFDQMAVIADRLRRDPDDRRCVLQIWGANLDLGVDSKDIPCNDTVTFQRGVNGELNMVVFCRSNDAVFGAYFANAFHFSMLLEYMANWIGCPVGTYTQVSVNWHGYTKTLEPLKSMLLISSSWMDTDLYTAVSPVRPALMGSMSHEQVDGDCAELLKWADRDFQGYTSGLGGFESEWSREAYLVLKAHSIYRNLSAPDRFDEALKLSMLGHTDWSVAMTRWLLKRRANWEAKLRG